MFENLKKSVSEELFDNEIDIHNCDYKKHEAYKKIKSKLIADPIYGFITFEEFIERYLLSKDEVIKTYKSIYDMGNPYELSKDECESSSIMLEILKAMSDSSFPNKSQGLKDRIHSKGYTTEMKQGDMEENANEKSSVFTRLGGYADQILKYLKIDLEKFDDNNIQNKRDKAKVFYFIYMIKNKIFPKTNILQLLNNPSMENIDNSYFDMNTYNGSIINTIKYAIEKELALDSKKKIKDITKDISLSWDKEIENVFDFINEIYINGFDNDFDEIIDSILEQISNISIAELDNDYEQTLMETLYLRIVQHEYIGNVKDILIVNSQTIHVSGNAPKVFISEMKKLHYIKIELNSIEEYINKNAFRLAKYVYWDANPNKEDVRRLRKNATKVRRFLDFCKRAKPLLDIMDISNELQIVSVLQAIVLDCSDETLDYKFYGYEKYMSHKPSVQAALKDDKRKKDDTVLDIIQVYWTRKVTDHWYANIGRYEIREKIRKFEYVFDTRFCEVFSQRSLEQMKKTHYGYISSINREIRVAGKQIEAVKDFISYLHSKGFKYIDENYKIRHVFSCINEINSVLINLKFLINRVINDIDPTIEIESDIGEVGENHFVRFILLFDYKMNKCTLSDFEIT